MRAGSLYPADDQTQRRPNHDAADPHLAAAMDEGGVQLLSVGVIGEYVGKIYLETKRRPRYIIEETTEE